MLFWLIEAAGVSHELVQKACQGAESATSLQGKSAAVRKIVPWEVLKTALIGQK